MPRASITRRVAITPSARVAQLDGMFDLPRQEVSECHWNVHLPIAEKPWHVGLIVGPSGCGKSTIAKEMFGENLVHGFAWPADRALLDGFPAAMSIKDVIGLLSAVGFSSPPAWRRPFHVLSNGEQFRATLARALAEQHELVVLDEFSSVVDRTVARIGSAAVAKATRRRGQKLIAVTCHEDVLQWLQPDWVYEPATNVFSWRLVQPRPRIALRIFPVHRSAWRLFHHHHYLSSALSRSATCYVGFVEERAAVFTAVLSFPHPRRPGWREHRTVCLPDFQGVGLGNAMSAFIAGVYAATGKPYRGITSHPAMIQHRHRSRLWKMIRAPSLGNRQTNMPQWPTTSMHRLTATFEYMGPVLRAEARVLGVLGKSIKKDPGPPRKK